MSLSCLSFCLSSVCESLNIQILNLDELEIRLTVLASTNQPNNIIPHNR